MLTVSDEYQYHVQSDVQSVKPSVVATWADSRNLENVRVISTEDQYYDKGLFLNPALFYKFTESSFTTFNGSQSPSIGDYSSNQINLKTINGVAFDRGSLITSESTSDSVKTTTYLSCDGTAGASGSYAYLSSGGDANITDNMTIIMKLTASIPSSGSKTLYGRYGNALADRAYRLQINSTKTLSFSWYNTLNVETTMTSNALDQFIDITNIATIPFWIKVTLYATRSPHVCKFSVSLDGQKWIDQSVTAASGTTSIRQGVNIPASVVGADFTGTSNVSANNFTGKVFDVSVYALTDPTSLSSREVRPYFENTGTGNGKWLIGDTSDIDERGKTWTLGAAASIAGSSYISSGGFNTTQDTLFNGENNLFFETWIKFDELGTASQTNTGTILHLSTGSATAVKIYTVAGIIKADATIAGPSTVTLTGSSSVVTSTIYHIVFSITTTNNVKIARLIINSVIQQQKILNSSLLTLTSGILNIGAVYNGSTVSDVLTGLKIGGLAIYNDSSILFSPFAFAYARYKAGSVAIVNQKNDYFEADEVINNRSSESFYWATLDAVTNANLPIKASKQYYLAEEDPDKKKNEYGWWSNVESDANGAFSNKPKVFIEFDSRKVNYIDVATSSIFNKIKQFNLSYLLDGNYQYNNSIFYRPSSPVSISPQKTVSSVSYPIIDNPFYYNSVASGETLSIASPSNASPPVSTSAGLDIIMHIAPVQWVSGTNQVLASKYTTSGNLRCWKFTLLSDGKLQFIISTNGSSDTNTYTSTSILNFANNSKHWVRVTHDKSGGTVRFYTSDDGSTDSWIMIGETTGIASLTYNSNAAPIRLASDSSGNAWNFVGDIYRAQIFGYNTTSGLDFMPTIFSVGTSGSASVTDAALNVWTMTNGSILRDSYLQCSGIALEVESTKYPLDRARVIEISPIYKTDVSDDVIDMSLNKVRENYDSSVPLGITGANSFDVNLQNTDQKYNKYNTSSPYYPYIDPEIKLKTGLKYPKFALSFPGIVNNYVGTPNTNEFNSITTLSLRFEISTEDWITPTTIISKSATGSLSWEMEFGGSTVINNNLSPTLKAYFSSNGTTYAFTATSTTGCDFIAGKKYFIRCDLYQASGVSKVQFYKSNDGITWSTVGSEISHTAAITLANNTNSIIIGNKTTKLNSFKIYSADIRVGGTSVANPNFSKNVNYDTTTVIDDYGKIWTVNQSGTGNLAMITTPKYLTVNNTGGLAYSVDSSNFSSASADGLDIRVKMTLDNWYPADDQFIACKGDYGDYVGYPSYSGPAGEWYFKFNGSSDSWLEFYATSNVGGTACIDKVTDIDLGVTFEPFSTHWLRVVYTKSTTDISFYYSDDGKNWTKIGTSGSSALATGIYDSTYPLMLGGVVGKSESNFVDGKIHYFSYGDNSAKTYSQLDFSAWNDGVTTGVDLQGNVWTATGAVDEDYETIPFGTFYTDSIDNDGSSMVAGFKCRDRSRFLQEQTMPEGFVYSNITAASAISNLAKIGNVPASKIKIQENFSEFVKKLGPSYYFRLNEKGQPTRSLSLSNGVRAGSYHHSTYFSFDEKYPNDAAYNITPQVYDFYFESAAITVEFWIKSSASDTGNIFTIFDKGNTDSNAFKILFAANGTDLNYQINNSTNVSLGDTAIVINDGKWHHVAVTAASGSSSNVKCYIDGVLRGTKSLTYSYLNPITVNGATVNGGGRFVIGSTNTNVAMEIADLRVWSNVRTQVQIVDNMSRKLLGHETGLAAYWQFNDILDANSKVEYCKNMTNPSYWLANVSTTADNSLLTLNKTSNLFASIDSSYTANINYPNASAALPLLNQNKLITDKNSSSININSSFIQVLNGTGTIAGSEKEKFNAYQEFTFSCFVKPSSLSSEKYIFSSSSAANAGVKISITSTGTIKVYYGNTSKETSTAPIVADGVYHIVFVASKSLLNSPNGTLSIYVNGISVFSESNISLLARHLADNIFIGNSGDTGALNTFTGLMSEVAIFPIALTADEVSYMYEISQAIDQTIYPSLYGNEDIWNSMLEIATADVGMFYFDEEDNFIYEDGNRFYDPQYDRYTVSQYNLDDSINIISANQNFSIVANSISCKIYKNVMDSNGDNNVIWQAENDASLASTYLESAISASAKTINFATEQDDDVYYPVFGTSGYIKIDSEIIKFNNTQKGVLTVEERGALGTKPAYHASGALLGELRVYEVEFSNSPIAYVKGPYADAVYDGYATYESWSAGSYKGRLVIAAVGSSVPKYVLLNGTDMEDKVNVFQIIGIPGLTEGTDSSESAIVENKESIRKFGFKELIIDNKFIQSKEQADALVNFLINYYKNNVEILNMEIIGLPHLQLSDRITVVSYDPMNIVNKDFWIISSSVNYDGGVSQSLTLREVPS